MASNITSDSSDKKKEIEALEAELGYISQAPSQFHAQETFKEKFQRKFKENPLVPLGLLATTIVLGRGIWTMKTGDKVKSQKMMRMRVLAQGLTVVALIGGVAFSAFKKRAVSEEK
ncbi:DgyrCDS5330 [Dimorphilus gyrociliatus]|uniref:DgyrCDS5330 n=1 Tax=Dimorphilus gyrociliatus TaxID=2664684 RepID=A0A7I8VK95_9ANNE|nr:DgyrCDS5330 [Dimorphilus gyrociliatus]